MDIKKNIRRSVFFQILNLVVLGITGIVFIPFLISSMGKDQYGLFEIIFSFNLINVLLDIGIGTTITNFSLKYFNSGIGKFSKFYWSYFWLKVFLSLVGFLFCLSIPFFSNKLFVNLQPNEILILNTGFVIFAFGVLIQNINAFFDNIQQGFVRFELPAYSNVASKLIYILLFFLWINSGVYENILGYCMLTFIIYPLLRLVIQIFQTNSILPLRDLKFCWMDLDLLKSDFSFLKGISLITILGQSYNFGPQIILSVIGTPALIADFSIAKKVIDFIRKISDMFIRPFLPATSELLKIMSLENLVFKGVKIHSFLILLLTFCVIINNKLIGAILVDEENLKFSFYLTLYTLILVIPSFAVPLMVYYNQGRYKMSILFNLANTIFSLLFSFVSFNFFGLTGFIIVLVLVYGLLSLFQVYSYSKFFKLSFKKYILIYFKNYLVFSFLWALYYLQSSLLELSDIGSIITNIIFCISYLVISLLINSDIIKIILRK
ncbi:lipopolysaccharide biosynthesis protein [Echinicola salinicaeni]|uniref:lipopolysaccharide biosynthesis protein n=1 Tax=Echinicola salinicaeni TaxID=2762757 RepID=UPI0016445DD2|nr:hypothetical protein [Echinicola salinicaeni]